MSTINSTTSTIGTHGTGTTTPAKNPGILDKDGFLKLLVGQMTNQDPMDPKGSMDIGQMAQMSMVEQLTALAGSTQSLLDQSRMSSVLGLVGKTVTYNDENDAPVTGVVSTVSVVGGVPSMTINGVAGISANKISQVS
jgi:flagellar basal-body rod modification protein FlgD